MKHNQNKFVYLEISFWEGYGGQHYYGSLKGYLNNEYASIELSFILTKKQAQKLGVKYYEKGDESTRFFSEQQLITYAIKTFKQHFPEAEVLILGRIISLEPQRILVGPVKYKEKVNEFAEQCEALGWWDGKNEKEVEIIWNKWKELRNNTFPSR